MFAMGYGPFETGSMTTDLGAAGISAGAAAGTGPILLGAPSGRAQLTEEQKKANHIASEKKRRNNIREQYDKLAELVPGMRGQGRSEGRVLANAVNYSIGLLEERAKLIEEIEAAGDKVDPELKTILVRARLEAVKKKKEEREANAISPGGAGGDAPRNEPSSSSQRRTSGVKRTSGEAGL
jgi:heteromeric Ino2p/Ino4p transcription factor